jgi:hypothetical protein
MGGRDKIGGSGIGGSGVGGSGVGGSGVGGSGVGAFVVNEGPPSIELKSVGKRPSRKDRLGIHLQKRLRKGTQPTHSGSSLLLGIYSQKRIINKHNSLTLHRMV